MITLLLWILSRLIDVLTQLGYEVAGEVLAKRIVKRIPSLQLKLKIPVSISTHNRELESRVREMPFLYKDLQEEVLNDFAEVEINRIDINTLHFVEKAFSKMEVNERLQISKKVLLLGNAGIGKTTFQRHSLLKILTNRPEVDFLYDNENPVTFYVPLKVVDDNKPLPILKYLLHTNRLFAGSHKANLKRLIGIVKQRGIFLFIDGYDEIQFLGGKTGRNYVRDELNLILESGYFSPDRIIPKDPTEKDFYDSLANQRVWLSSRREFFKQYPIRVISQAYKSPSLIALAVKGVTESRMELVANIFRKHPKYSHLLDAKYFIKEVDKAEDQDLIESSYNPLFLTIMSYVYMRKVIDKQTYKVRAARNYYELISECIDLLLIGLDEGKIEALGLNEPQKEAESSVRNACLDEKRAFLPYFAAELFFDGKAVFDIGYIKTKAAVFFERQSQLSNRDNILKTLHSDSVSNPNFAQQLTLQGIFVIADRQPSKDLYDFPHRRFREVLAAQHFMRTGPDFLLANLHQPRLSELVLVFFGMSESRDLVLRALLESMIGNSEPKYFADLLTNCIEQAPASYKPENLIRLFLTECIEANVWFSLPAFILEPRYFAPGAEFLGLLSDKFKECLRGEKIAALCLCCDLLSRFDPQLLRELVVWHLKPWLGINNAPVQLLLAFPQVRSWLQNLRYPPAFLDVLSYLESLFDDIVKANRTVPYATGRKPRTCYIVSDPVIKITEEIAKRLEVPDESCHVYDLSALKFKVFFAKDFINDPAIRIDSAIKRFVLRKSSINYGEYNTIMRNIEDFRQNTSRQVKFFR